ncbi:PIN domain-containing protein [Sporichthya sp.]|uniref:type II toxin-antitoxin system VapC family toxin n=1 Tax=Sporichthya sp. TaxID=65475 RepID=UPI001837F421|nr:PIN domain-containing protein [Sporichthya sp.]MBA3744196.1 PIN domain-containing protein [Sporichthya sp.]
MDAFDADVLIYAAGSQPLGGPVRALIHDAGDPAGIGSLLLVPELLAKPMRRGWTEELTALGSLLAQLDLRPVDGPTAELAAELGATYSLRALDATHLATAVLAGADRFVTNNRRDFPTSIAEISITYPDQL